MPGSRGLKPTGPCIAIAPQVIQIADRASVNLLDGLFKGT